MATQSVEHAQHVFELVLQDIASIDTQSGLDVLTRNIDTLYLYDCLCAEQSRLLLVKLSNRRSHI